MGRAIVAVIVSYVLIFILCLIAFIGAYVIVGPAFAFKPGIYEASSGWIGVSFVINIVTAIIGGLICAVIAKGGKAPLALAVVVFVINIALAIPSVSKRQNNMRLVRAADTSPAVAAQMAYWPPWVPFTFPFTGAIGVLIGAKLKRRS